MPLTRRHLIAASAATAAFAPRLARAEVGVTEGRILFGEAAAFGGPAGALGTGMRTGIRAAFAEINAQGGVAGRKLELASADDGYEPTQSIEATRKLIEETKVFALIGPVGTPTSAAAQPIAATAGVPFIAPLTGAAFLRAADMTGVVNLRASYFQETEQMVERLTHDLGCARIAVMYQDDAYGRDGSDGVKAALGRRSLPVVAEGTYERNTIAVKGAVLAVRKGDPDAVIMIGAYKPCAEFIKLARKIKLDVPFVNISFVGSAALAKELGPEGAGVVVTQVVPFPFDAAIPVVGRYQAALKALDRAPDGARDGTAAPDYASLEGYLAGRLAIAALQRQTGEATRAGLMQAIAQGGPFDFGGFVLRFAPGHNQGSDQVFLTVLQGDGSFRPVTTLTHGAG
jgi:ABC-type branched-subunit amino acid transport system substrate-binding protein